jgi:hypothetical protein
MRANKRNAGAELKPHGNNSSVALPSRTIKTRARAERGTKKGHFGACYKPLPTRLRRNGFDYRQIAREGDAAIYEQTWDGCSNPSVAYEVVRIRRREASEIAGKLIGAAEVYPRPEAWGIDGFTFTDKGAAFAKLRELRGGNPT